MLAADLFSTPDALIRLDMSEYMENIQYQDLSVRLPAMWDMTRQDSLPKNTP